MRELTAEDFKRGKKNPFFHKLNKEVETYVKNDTYAIYEEIAKLRGVTPEIIMNSCLESYAKELQAHD